MTWKTLTIAALVLCAATLSAPQNAKALTLDLGGSMTWSGQSVPAEEADSDIVYDASIQFDDAFAVAEVRIKTSSLVAPGTVDDAEWSLLDTPTKRIYSGEEIRLTLNGGDWTESATTAENFFDRTQSIDIQYFPASIAANFDTQLAGSEVIVVEPAASVLCLFAFVMSCAWLRQQQGRNWLGRA